MGGAVDMPPCRVPPVRVDRHRGDPLQKLRRDSHADIRNRQRRSTRNTVANIVVASRCRITPATLCMVDRILARTRRPPFQPAQLRNQPLVFQQHESGLNRAQQRRAISTSACCRCDRHRHRVARTTGRIAECVIPRASHRRHYCVPSNGTKEMLHREHGAPCLRGSARLGAALEKTLD
jgi:hypothetical protein